MTHSYMSRAKSCERVVPFHPLYQPGLIYGATLPSFVHILTNVKRRKQRLHIEIGWLRKNLKGFVDSGLCKGLCCCWCCSYIWVMAATLADGGLGRTTGGCGLTGEFKKVAISSLADLRNKSGSKMSSSWPPFPREIRSITAEGSCHQKMCR